MRPRGTHGCCCIKTWSISKPYRAGNWISRARRTNYMQRRAWPQSSKSEEGDAWLLALRKTMHQTWLRPCWWRKGSLRWSTESTREEGDGHAGDHCWSHIFTRHGTTSSSTATNLCDWHLQDITLHVISNRSYSSSPLSVKLLPMWQGIKCTSQQNTAKLLLYLLIYH
jgi:hypothetical protein